MPLRIALSIDACSTPLKALEQVLRDRHAHVFVLRSDDPLGAIDEAEPDVVVITSAQGAPLAQSIHERFGEGAPWIIGVFPDVEAVPVGAFDERITTPLCARTLVSLLARGAFRAPSAAGPGIAEATRS